MKCKQIRLICAVKGCRNRISYFLTEGGDFAGAPNLCKTCIERAYHLVCENENIGKATEVNTKETLEPQTATDVPSETNTVQDELPEPPSISNEIPEAKTAKSTKNKRSSKKTDGEKV